MTNGWNEAEIHLVFPSVLFCLFCIENQVLVWGDGSAVQWVKALVSKPGTDLVDPSWKQRTDSCLSSGLHVCVHAHTYILDFV